MSRDIPVTNMEQTLNSLDGSTPPPPIGSAPVAFVLKAQPPALRAGFAVILVIITTLFGVAAGTVFVEVIPKALALWGGALAGLAAGVALGRLLRRRITPSPIEVAGDSLTVPKHLRSTKAVRIPLDAVTSVEDRIANRQPFLVIGTRRGYFLFPAQAFVEESGPARLRGTIHAAIAARLDGTAVLGAMRGREQRGVALSSCARTLPATSPRML